MSSTMFEQNVISVDRPDQIPLDQFMETMLRDTFVCIRGIITPQETETARQALTARFSRSNDHPATGQSADAVRRNFQKLNVGGENRSASNDDARLFRAFYNPIWEEDIYKMRDVFIRVAKVRNLIAELPEDFALDKIEPNGLWTAARIHQYPSGGGFFRRHTDYVVKDVADEKSTNFFQVLLTMTQKGEHFHRGGAFVDVGDERIFLDDYSQPGDIVVYDGRTEHGVEDVDPHLPMDLDTINGRLAGFVTLFKKM